VELQPLPLPWTFEPTIVGGILVAAASFAVWTRGRRASDRAWMFWAGLLAFVVALITPVDAASDRYLLSAHMLQHMLLTMVGPPLLLAGLPEDILLLDLGRLPRALVNPWVAVVLFNVTLMAWHLPGPYQATLLNEGLHVGEHILFIATAMLFWWPVVGPGSRGETRMSPLMRVGYLAFAGVPPTVIGITLAFVPVVLYPFYETAPRLLASVSPQLDQQIAGILMFGIGNLIYFVPITRNFMRAMEEQERAAETDRALTL
jgi:cytochrome c oxidase assembly factor CtaG